MDQNKVLYLLEEALTQNKELFLVDYHITPSGNIDIIVDGDKGVSIDECVRISRHIEHNLDRETEDFALTVSSPDITKPLSHTRQYRKNIGRTLQIHTQDDKIEGRLLDVNETSVSIHYTAKIPKEIGKGKKTVDIEKEIPFTDIIKAKVKIVYN